MRWFVLHIFSAATHNADLVANAELLGCGLCLEVAVAQLAIEAWQRKAQVYKHGGHGGK
jgi:hypothetical protein